MSGIEPDDPFSSFFEVVKVGRDWHWFPDVTIYYISQTRKFKVKGGCKVHEDNSSQNYRQLTIVMNRDEKHIFEIRRMKGGETYFIETDGYWLTGPNRFAV